MQFQKPDKSSLASRLPHVAKHQRSLVPADVPRTFCGFFGSLSGASHWPPNFLNELRTDLRFLPPIASNMEIDV
ncbi:hypothetical protein M5D96_014053 [Drosophila gunungcola]|uniref:Uncharacterized protein n=1 Tax=Drosophila gunungcola TaxID=103775 RepID=A0A9P9YAQ4_9MUSC|nr:hypothetical protein M5D96_014053 [Drosophila gunungcola]